MGSGASKSNGSAVTRSAGPVTKTTDDARSALNAGNSKVNEVAIASSGAAKSVASKDGVIPPLRPNYGGPPKATAIVAPQAKRDPSFFSTSSVSDFPSEHAGFARNDTNIGLSVKSELTPVPLQTPPNSRAMTLASLQSLPNPDANSFQKLENGSVARLLNEELNKVSKLAAASPKTPPTTRNPTMMSMQAHGQSVPKLNEELVIKELNKMNQEILEQNPKPPEPAIPSFHLDASPKETPGASPVPPSASPDPALPSQTAVDPAPPTADPPPPPLEVDERIEKEAAPETERRDTLAVSCSIDSGPRSTQVEVDDAEMDNRKAESLVDLDDLANDGKKEEADDRDPELERLTEISESSNKSPRDVKVVAPMTLEINVQNPSRSTLNSDELAAPPTAPSLTTSPARGALRVVDSLDEDPKAKMVDDLVEETLRLVKEEVEKSRGGEEALEEVVVPVVEPLLTAPSEVDVENGSVVALLRPDGTSEEILVVETIPEATPEVGPGNAASLVGGAVGSGAESVVTEKLPSGDEVTETVVDPSTEHDAAELPADSKTTTTTMLSSDQTHPKDNDNTLHDAVVNSSSSEKTVEEICVGPKGETVGVDGEAVGDAKGFNHPRSINVIPTLVRAKKFFRRRERHADLTQLLEKANIISEGEQNTGAESSAKERGAAVATDACEGANDGAKSPGKEVVGTTASLPLANGAENEKTSSSGDSTNTPDRPAITLTTQESTDPLASFLENKERKMTGFIVERMEEFGMDYRENGEREEVNGGGKEVLVTQNKKMFGRRRTQRHLDVERL